MDYTCREDSKNIYDRRGLSYKNKLKIASVMQKCEETPKSEHRLRRKRNKGDLEPYIKHMRRKHD